MITFDKKTNTIKFPSGAERYAYAGCVSLLDEKYGTVMAGGYDATIWVGEPTDWGEGDDLALKMLTVEDQIELADLMIERWKEYRESLVQ